MSRRLALDCDVCGTKDIGERDTTGVIVDLPREPGEMDGGATELHFCTKCCRRVLQNLVDIAEKGKDIPVHSAFVTYVSTLREKTAKGLKT